MAGPNPIPTGLLLWEGPSPVDDTPIICVLTGLKFASHNAKTGPMAQTWILLRDHTPVEAVQSGADAAICGSCPLRATLPRGRGRACYVVPFQAPFNVYRRYHEGVYPTWDGTEAMLRPLIAGKAVRFGAYGDPAFVPFWVWNALAVNAKGWTGYTHVWKTCDPWYQRLLMASVDNQAEYHQATAAGWRTFRVRSPYEDLEPREITCQASDEAGHRTTCEKCQLCRGGGRLAKNIAILPHGQRASQLTPASLPFGEDA